jgi:DNA repair protein RadC
MLKVTRRYREVVVKKDSLVLCDHSASYGTAPSAVLDNPAPIAGMWPAISGTPEFRDGQESFVVIFLSTRRRYLGHSVVVTGLLDQIPLHPREVFRGAIMANAHAIVMMHNHPSGDPSPSEADIRVTRDLCKVGQLLKIEVLDHVIVGQPNPDHRGWVSLRELGYFHY